MRAVVVDAPNAIPRVLDVPEPNLPAHGALIEVRATGVCRSDWHAWVGHDPTVAFPHVPGHEFAGVVVAVGQDVRGDWLGARVTAPFCCGCGTCARCTGGHEHLCVREYQPGFDGWGSFAERVMVPWADVNLARLPDALAFDAAAALGCRFMTSFHGLVDQAQLRAGETMAVFGCGGVGLSAVMIAHALGARVIAVDIDAHKLALAQSLGASTCIDAGTHDAPAAILAATQGEGVDVAVDALGSRATSAQGLSVVRPRGRYLQLGLLLAEDANPPVALQRVVRFEVSILGAHGMPASGYGKLFAFLEANALPIERLIGARRPLSEAADALAGMAAFSSVGVTILHP